MYGLSKNYSMQFGYADFNMQKCNNMPRNNRLFSSVFNCMTVIGWKLRGTRTNLNYLFASKRSLKKQEINLPWSRTYN